MKYIQMLFDTFITPIKDFRVVGWTCLAGLFAYMTDPQGLQLISVCCYVMFFWLFALCIRKVMFPYRIETTNGKRTQLNLSDFFKKAYRGNMAAAIVVASQVFFMCMVALSFILWVRP